MTLSASPPFDHLTARLPDPGWPANNDWLSAGSPKLFEPITAQNKPAERHVGDRTTFSALPAGYVHLGVVKEFPATLRSFGIDPDGVIRAAGIDPRLFDDETNAIAHSALGRLCTLSVAATGCPHVGLLVGQRGTITSLGLVGRLMLHSETVGDALRNLVAHLGVQNRGAVPALETAGDTAIFSFSVYQPDTESVDQISDGAIACTVNALRALLGDEWNPDEVLLPRSSPPDAQPFRRHFRAPVRFNEETAAIVFPRRLLKRRIAGADPLLRAMLMERIDLLKDRSKAELTDDIRRLLRTKLPRDGCSADGLADLFAVHRRTLNRRLKAEGTGFRAILNEIRYEVARQLLADTKLSFCQIAAALNYADPSAFTRAFRRWSGETPSAWRAGRGERRAGHLWQAHRPMPQNVKPCPM